MRLSQPVTQGGQTFLHRMRILGQIIRLASFFSTMVMLFTFGVLCYRSFSEKNVDQYILAWHVRFIQFFWGSQEIFKHYHVSYWVERTEQLLSWVHKTLRAHLYIAMIVWLVIFILIFLIWNQQGIQAHKKKTIAGSSIQPQKTVIRMIDRKQKASHLKLMDLPLIKDSETQHVLITGTTGSGKTNAFKHLMNQIRDQKAVILDTNGEFVSRYYDPSRDTLMNPFNKHFPGWDLWGECQTSYHYDEIAESLVPQAGNDPFWSQSARIVLSEILKNLCIRNECDIKKIIKTANMIPLSELHERLIRTKAAALIDPQSEKTATSIRMNLASHIACLEHLQEFHDNPVSIRQWIQDDSSNGWLFLAMMPAQRATLRPLLSCWLSIAIKSLMECCPHEQRRLWFMIDELPSLHQLTDLQLCLSEGRKYGACMVLGVQNIPQLEQLYSTQATQSLVDLCSTKILFRCASFAMAQKLSNLVGTQERQEIQEGISYGANDMRDGVSLNVQTKEKLIIPPHEFTNLPNLTSYVQLPHGYPITKIDWKFT